MPVRTCLSCREAAFYQLTMFDNFVVCLDYDIRFINLC